MNSHERTIWLAAARLESAQIALDQAKTDLTEVIGRALQDQEPLRTVASAANMTAIELLALSGRSAADFRPRATDESERAVS